MGVTRVELMGDQMAAKLDVIKVVSMAVLMADYLDGKLV